MKEIKTLRFRKHHVFYGGEAGIMKRKNTSPDTLKSGNTGNLTADHSHRGKRYFGSDIEIKYQ